MVFSVVGDGYLIGWGVNLKVRASLLLFEINVTNDAQVTADFAGNLFQKFCGLAHADHLTLVIYADIDDASLCISKSADPFEIFISPTFFVLRVLLFRHEKGLLAKGESIYR